MAKDLLRIPSDKLRIFSAFIRTSGAGQVLTFPADYDFMESATGSPPHPMCAREFHDVCVC